LRNMSQNQPTSERPKKFATEPDANAQNRCDRTSKRAYRRTHALEL
jgi:hypothetical protein